MNSFIKTLLLIASLGLSANLLASGDHDHGHDEHDEHHEEEPQKGVHNGRLLEDGDFVVELAIYEKDVPPEYRAWASVDGKSLKPGDWKLEVQLSRLGGDVNSFAFEPEQDFLRGQGVVEEPHSFDVKVIATYQNKQHQWTYPSYEGRITMEADVAAASGLTTAIAGEGVLQERIKLYGTIVADPLRVSHIQARYPGLIRSVKPTIGARVKAGDVLATVESNESLREYPLLAPIDGVVVERHSNPGEFTADRVLFTLLDERVLELHLQAFPTDASKIKTGQAITIYANGQQAQTKTEYITPRHGETPTLEVHAPVDNSAGNWVPNQAVEGWVDIAQTPVPLMVDNRALQSFRDWQVVFIQIGDTYEIRPLELGRTDGQFTEVLSGLNAGDSYVVENSFLLKADLEKSGASHDH
ncbi:efflux RND transporter periplasmic adaptor subunit [Cellvibrio fibrivorans]|uniref:Cobalt-zinc-cadmium efflux system membrane fusion protein n=1 Tax=Cellvibrio fibrivorans TaxID=126350 RepID=A0ABU1V1Y0_9GAMM|nr:HlyD family efflux transporter periplasmic adaptor subunit [Cellvibrio fibrivorans]MDR7091387.1 cobalt-zinc-cadmium efflux system membrane fusion protein [Cellvibrio fibrivorans]